jgi:hypothetical protein
MNKHLDYINQVENIFSNLNYTEFYKYTTYYFSSLV